MLLTTKQVLHSAIAFLAIYDFTKVTSNLNICSYLLEMRI